MFGRPPNPAHAVNAFTKSMGEATVAAEQWADSLRASANRGEG